ncbi:MAG: hypothetical protein AAGH15_04545 [Myxococcota bacterium]
MVLLCGVLTACFSNSIGGGGAPEGDAGARDAGGRDVGLPDLGVDGGTVMDAGSPDAGSPDAGVPDAGLSDAGLPDDGAGDLGVPAGYRRHLLGGPCYYDEALDPAAAVTLDVSACDADRWPREVCAELAFTLDDGAELRPFAVRGRGQGDVQPIVLFLVGDDVFYVQLDDATDPPRVTSALRLPGGPTHACRPSAYASGDGAAALGLSDGVREHLLQRRHEEASFGDPIATLEYERPREATELLGVHRDLVVHRHTDARRTYVLREEPGGGWVSVDSSELGIVTRAERTDGDLLAWVFAEGLVRLALDPLRVAEVLHADGSPNGGWSTDGAHHLWFAREPGGSVAFRALACAEGICDVAHLDDGAELASQGETRVRAGLAVYRADAPEIWRLENLSSGRTGSLRVPDGGTWLPVLAARHAYAMRDDDGRWDTRDERIVRVAYEPGLAPPE